MTYEAGNERPAHSGQGQGQGRGQGGDAGAHRVPTPSERGAEAEPDALHDPAQAGQPGRTARDFGVTGAGGSNEVGPLHRPSEGQGTVPGPPVPSTQTQTQTQAPAQAPGQGRGAHLLPHGERDKLGLRLQQAVNHFVDEPRRAVEEADHVLEEATRHVAETLAEHRRSLRGAWESEDREAETEELRVALRKYREVTERLLQM
ncbi:hypothetical protein ACH4SP_19275 [Streptomyces sp. NPDC021093]|uniref:hypothetical protein n=1 Tax=Streptomyces sp. NPDC021093 TaxID=3365112 RepID=UPI0037A8C4B8